FQPFELTLMVSGSDELSFQPFAADAPVVSARVHCPDGTVKTIAAFWSVPYTIEATPADGGDRLVLASAGHYAWRFLPELPGRYDVTFTLWEAGLPASQATETFMAIPDIRDHSIRLAVEPKNRRTFVTGDGRDFIPNGQNLCWPVPANRFTGGIACYDRWLADIAAFGGNTVRIWLTPWNFGLFGQSTTDFANRMGEMAKLEHVLRTAADRGVYCILCFFQHGLFSEKVNPAWSQNPFNRHHGGYLDRPELFFTDERAWEDVCRMFRYMLARFASDENVFAWELFNEVDWTDAYDGETVARWHGKAAAFLKANDPYGHLVTTSHKSHDGACNALADIDFCNPHSYDYVAMNPIGMLQSVQEMLFQKYHKPILHSEIGFDWRSGFATRKQDPQGIHFLQCLYGGLFAGGAGAAMHWWWDSYIDPAGLCRHYRGFAVISHELVIAGTTAVWSSATVRDAAAGVSACGITADERVYLLLYDEKWDYRHPDIQPIGAFTVSVTPADRPRILSVRETSAGTVIQTATIPAGADAIVIAGLAGMAMAIIE
ncbi:MAG: cellulase family glycosylhydrolase, partial [bacterium]